MLILSRKVDEEIVIGDDVVITVLSIRNGTVRLGVTAPRDVAVMRSEIIKLPARGRKAVRDAR